MPSIELVTLIEAPIYRVFDLSRSIDLHVVSMHERNEVPIAGAVTGLIELGESVTWRARHFGVSFELTSKIVAFDPPRHFRDAMTQGIFARFDHDHFFNQHAAGTEMRDAFDYTSPLGPLGKLADFLFLRRYMVGLLESRNQVIKSVAESSEWHQYLRPRPG